MGIIKFFGYLMPYLFEKIVHRGRKTERVKIMEDQNTTGTATVQQQEKTFTQEQVNAIVSKRLAEDRASRVSEFDKREKELNQREMQIKAKELLSERGLPKSLADVLRYSDEESLKAAIDVIDKTRGFKESSVNTEQNNGKKRIMENPLPNSNDDVIGDPLRKAMGLK
jgi:hypothetical protein